LEVSQSANLAAELGRQNQERAQQFSLERMVERYQRLYGALG
jgi:hypothetical protein